MRETHRPDNATGPGPRHCGRCVSYHVRRSCTTIRISAPLGWSAINAIPFALDARLPYSLSEEQAYDDHTNLVS
jgi:hypothetical protein